MISQLHGASVTHGFLAGIVLCKSGASIRYCLCTCQLHTLIGWELMFRLHTHTSVTQKNCFQIICVTISGLIVDFLLSSHGLGDRVQNQCEKLDGKRLFKHSALTKFSEVQERGIGKGSFLHKIVRNRLSKMRHIRANLRSKFLKTLGSPWEVLWRVIRALKFWVCAFKVRILTFKESILALF